MATNEELKERIEAGIPGASAEVSGDGHHFDAVVVAPITGVRTDRFDAVVLWGLHSGGFGGGSDEDAPIVARELAYVAVTRARRSLTCIRQVAGADVHLHALAL